MTDFIFAHDKWISYNETKATKSIHDEINNHIREHHVLAPYELGSIGDRMSTASIIENYF